MSCVFIYCRVCMHRNLGEWWTVCGFANEWRGFFTFCLAQKWKLITSPNLFINLP